MIWALVLLALFLIIGYFGHIAKKRADAKFARDFSEAEEYYCRRISTGEVKYRSPEGQGYHPVRGEVVFAFLENVVNHDTNAKGRLVITNKAFVFESSDGSERLVYTALSNVEAKRDGVEIRRQKGPRRAFKLSNPRSLGLLLAAYSQAS